jgi:hypothetical protein
VRLFFPEKQSADRHKHVICVLVRQLYLQAQVIGGVGRAITGMLATLSADRPRATLPGQAGHIAQLRCAYAMAKLKKSTGRRTSSTLTMVPWQESNS